MNQFPASLNILAAAIAAVLFYLAGKTAVNEDDQFSLKFFLLMFIALWTAVLLRQHLLYDTLVVPSTIGLVVGISSAKLAAQRKGKENDKDVNVDINIDDGN